MVGEKRIKKSKMDGLSQLFVDKDENVSDEAAGQTVVFKDTIRQDVFSDHGHTEGVNILPDDVGVYSPENIPKFLDSIRDIKSSDGQAIYSVLRKGDTFSVFKDDGNGGQIEVLNGNTKTCKMSSPLDQNILNAYIKAHQGKTIIVDRCRTVEAVKELIKACHSNGAIVKFRAEIFEELQITDPWITRYALPPEPALPDIQISSNSSKRQKL
jgi:hypothetical protein